MSSSSIAYATHDDILNGRDPEITFVQNEIDSNSYRPIECMAIEHESTDNGSPMGEFKVRASDQSYGSTTVRICFVCRSGLERTAQISLRIGRLIVVVNQATTRKRY